MKISRTRKDISKLKDKTHIEDVSDFLANIKMVKRAVHLKDSEIEILLNKWYTFSEILAWEFNDEWIFEPEEIIMKQTEKYLLSNSYNTYANQSWT